MTEAWEAKKELIKKRSKDEKKERTYYSSKLRKEIEDSNRLVTKQRGLLRKLKQKEVS